MSLKLTDDVKIEILRLDAAGFSSRQIASRLGVGKSTIGDWLRGESYAEWWEENGNKDLIDITGGPKILTFDIETAPIQASVWRLFKENVGLNQIEQDWFVLSWAAKWFHENEVIYQDKRDSWDNEDDSDLLQGMWNLLDEADIVIGQNCVEVSTPVLKQDLTWAPVGDLKVGDKLVGFEEGRPPNTTCRNEDDTWVSMTERGGRKVKPAVVTEHCIERKPCVEVTLSNGDKVITTHDHYWLACAEKDNNMRWYKSANLRAGQRVKKYCDIWGKDNSYEAGWLAGFVAGEGSLHRSKSSCVSSIGFCQRPGVTWDTALDYSQKLNLEVCPERSPHKGGIGRGDVLYADWLGGKWKTIEIIGKLGIGRFLEKINWDDFGTLKGSGGKDVVVSVRDIGERDVAVMGTSTSTFIAAGYAMHNCKKFDIKKLNARFLLNGYQPPSDYRVIDTLEIAKRHFGFTSNKLEYMTSKLCKKYKKSGHGKYPGFLLWKETLKGNQEAWREMEEYNILDVLSLEELYTILRPWYKQHPNFNIYYNDNQIRCSCGSTNLENNGFVYSNLSKFTRFRCQDCGAEVRDRVNLLPKEKRQSLRGNIAR